MEEARARRASGAKDVDRLPLTASHESDAGAGECACPFGAFLQPGGVSFPVSACGSAGAGGFLRAAGRVFRAAGRPACTEIVFSLSAGPPELAAGVVWACSVQFCATADVSGASAQGFLRAAHEPKCFYAVYLALVLGTEGGSVWHGVGFHFAPFGSLLNCVLR